MGGEADGREYEVDGAEQDISLSNDRARSAIEQCLMRRRGGRNGLMEWMERGEGEGGAGDVLGEREEREGDATTRGHARASYACMHAWTHPTHRRDYYDQLDLSTRSTSRSQIVCTCTPSCTICIMTPTSIEYFILRFSASMFHYRHSPYTDTSGLMSSAGLIL